jgi:dienelactone hydrolase
MRRSFSKRWRGIGWAFALFGLSGAAVAAVGARGAEAVTAANCAAFVVSGNPSSTTGATWTYRSTDQGVRYVLEGILFVPAGSGPVPAVVVSHGKGGTPRGYSATIARTMVGWGMVVIGPMYTHAPDADDQGNAPDGPDGASQANVQRARKAYDLLSCVSRVDLTRVAAHGHSMGAFVTGQVLGTFPTLFRAASHTAGGVSDGPNATTRTAAAQIITPYQLHHGDQDQVVALAQDQTLDQILTAHGTPHELHVYAGFDHQRMAFDSTMLARVRTWYQTNGVL